MIQDVALSLFSLLVGYAAGFACGYVAITRFSSNRHDRSVEAAMTGAFVVGPIVSLLSLIGTLVFLFSRGV